MSRLSIHVDETNPSKPVTVLVINGQECRISDRELENLLNDIVWAKGSITKARGTYFSCLASKYKEVTCQR